MTRRFVPFGLQVALALVTGCSPEWYRQSADDEATAILKKERKELLGEESDFKVQQAPLSVDQVGVSGEREDFKRAPAPQPVQSPLATSAVDGSDGAKATPPGAHGGGAKPEGAAPSPPTEVKNEGPKGEPSKPVIPPASGRAASDAPPSEPPAAEPQPPAPIPSGPGDSKPPAPTEETPSEAARGEGQGAEGQGPASPRETGAQGGNAPGPGAAAPAPAGAQVAGGKSAVLGAPKVPARVLSLEAALLLAFANNRDYQGQKETTYLSALTLTLAQHQFAPRFFGVVAGDWKDDRGTESGSIVSSLGLDLVLMNGARLSINVLNNLLKFFSGDRAEVANTIIEGSFTQPLLRGFGTEIAREPLTQAERNVVYAVRAFKRYQKTLAVQVISEYYRVLQTRDRVTNEYNNWQGLVTSRDRVEALAGAERVPKYQVDQARQDELRAQDSWVSAVESYETSLDRFKLVLGIPTDSEIALDQRELERLASEPVKSMGITAEEAVAVALRDRLDLKTVRDQVEDSERQIRVAADRLRMQLDVGASAALASGDGEDQKPFKFNSNNLSYGFGFDVDLPFDRKAERNAYVNALIGHERDKRGLTEQEDNIRLTIRDAYRGLEREIVSYKIQLASVGLAEMRVDSTSALLQAGRAETRDLLDSQTSLITARNALTGSVITYAIARLVFLRDTEVLQVNDQGLVWAQSIGEKPDA